MKRMHDYDTGAASFAAGVKTTLAALLVGLLVALGLGLAPSAPSDDRAGGHLPAAAREVPGSEATVYFPSQYKLDATEPAEHVQAF